MVPKVSVIVPVFNCERYIYKCVTSILNQTYKEIEIIIVNDGSTDQSEKVLRKFKETDPRIRYYFHENSGPSVTRNFGIEMAIGEYIVFVDSDDNIEDDYIESLIRTAIEFECDIVSCGYREVSQYGIVELNDFWKGQTIVLKDDFISNIFKGIGGTLWGKIFRRDLIIKKNIRLEPNISMCEDMLFVLEYCIYCNRFGSIKKNLYSYNRLNEDSISAKINTNYYINLLNVITKIEVILKAASYNKNFIDFILRDRVQNLLLNFITMQHNKHCSYSSTQKLNNLDTLLDNVYIKKYRMDLSSKLLNEKLLLFLIKKDKRKLLNNYSFFLFYSFWIKEKLKTKTLANNIKQNKLIFEEDVY
jgi:glycosyltransferase involved in cell wall biosynthesis